MIDLNKVRENVVAYKEICKNKNKNVDVDKVLELDDKRKELQQKIDSLKYQQKEFAAKKDYDSAKNLKLKIQEIESEYSSVYVEYMELLKTLPNFIHEDTPI